jgi:hypothetical protein
MVLTVVCNTYFEHLYLEFRTTDNVQKPSNSESIVSLLFLSRTHISEKVERM